MVSNQEWPPIDWCCRWCMDEDIPDTEEFDIRNDRRVLTVIDGNLICQYHKDSAPELVSLGHLVSMENKPDDRLILECVATPQRASSELMRQFGAGRDAPIIWLKRMR